MTSQVRTLESQVLALPEQQRAGLVLKLLDSIEHRSDAEPAAVQAAWIKEANGRYQAYLRGEDEAISAEQALDELRAEDR